MMCELQAFLQEDDVSCGLNCIASMGAYKCTAAAALQRDQTIRADASDACHPALIGSSSLVTLSLHIAAQ